MDEWQPRSRTWAIESATGLGRLLAQQLVAAGESVVDVPPTLAARIRLLGSAKAAKNDPNDALATATSSPPNASASPGTSSSTSSGLDRDLADAKQRITDAVTGSGTTLTELHGFARSPQR